MSISSKSWDINISQTGIAELTKIFDELLKEIDTRTEIFKVAASPQNLIL